MCLSLSPRLSLFSRFSFNLAQIFGEIPVEGFVSSADAGTTTGSGTIVAVGSGVKGDDANAVGAFDDVDVNDSR